MNLFRNSLLLSALAVSGAASAASIYGLSTGTSKGIYSIDVNTGAATQVYSLTNLGAKDNRDDNGLAFDQENGAFYYSNNGKFVRRDAMGETVLGNLASKTADATWYDGAYWYVTHSNKVLRKVTIGMNGITDSVVSNNVPGLNSASYGDLASLEDGTFYAANSNGFFKGDLDNPAGGVTNLNNQINELQLGFYGSDLYAVQTDTDKLFSMNLVTGAATQTGLLADRSLFITDAASQPVPEPASMAALGLGAMALLRRRKKA